MPPSQLHVFTNQNAHLVQSYYTSPAQVWLQGFDDLLGKLGSSPAACSYLNAGQEQIHVFARGHDNRLWQTFWDGSEWLGWFEFDDRLVESPTAAQFDNEGDVQLHVFYQGHGQQLWQRFYGAGGWLGPFELPGQLASSPAATEYLNEGQRQLHVFFKGPTGMLCQLFYDGVWRGPFELVGPIHSAPAVAQYDHNGQRELHVFYRTAGGSLAQYQYIPGQGWQGPFDRGGALTDAPTATAYVNSGQSQVHIFGRGQNHHLSQLFFDGRHWLGWFELGQSMSGQPAATSYQQPDLEPANVQVASSGNEPAVALSGTTLAAAWNAPGPQQQVVATSSVGNIQTWSQATSSTPTGLQAWGDAGLASLGGGNFTMVFLGRYFNLNTFDILAGRTLARGGWSPRGEREQHPNQLRRQAAGGGARSNLRRHLDRLRHRTGHAQPVDRRRPKLGHAGAGEQRRQRPSLAVGGRARLRCRRPHLRCVERLSARSGRGCGWLDVLRRLDRQRPDVQGEGYRPPP